MRNQLKLRLFLSDNQAISEEFTALPALSVVMIGLTLFVILLAQTYMTHTDHMNRLQNYFTADNILQKQTNPDSFFITESGVIDLPLLQKNTTSLQNICTQYQRLGIAFFLRLRCNNHTQDFPQQFLSIPLNRIAVSKHIGVYLNEAQTMPGTFTIFLWEDSQ